MDLIAKINVIIHFVHLLKQGAGKFFTVFKLALGSSFKSGHLDRMHTLI